MLSYIPLISPLPRFTSININSKTPKRASLMKDRPPSSYGGVYVPPHHRLRSVITTTINSRIRDEQSAVINPRTTSSQPYLQSQQEQHQLAPKSNGNNSYNTNNSQCDLVFGDAISEDSSDLELHSLPTPGSYLDEWKRKFVMLLRDKDKQELVTREKKDRLDYQDIAALASKMGLYSHLYVKVAVFSKVPLPNYRFDLDDKRPQREVNFHIGLWRRIDAYLGEYLSQKSRTKESFQDNSFSRSTSSGRIATDEGLFEQQEPLASSKAVMEKILRRRSLQLRDQQQAWKNSHEGEKMMEFRRSLPAYKEKDSILTTISHNQVVIISGETGCGKTTQIPQFILESEIESIHGADCSIICTQPRRISAMSVSERVASERGEKLGESVGYKVRLEGMKGRDTRLLFCTTGILLRRLLVDRNLKGVTHVIVDEIHERGMNEDFLLVVLKDLLARRPELRLILMSATLDAELFSSFFGGAPVLNIPGFTYTVQTHFLEEILEMTGYIMTPYNQSDDYGQEKMWKMSKQAPRKRKSQIASVVEDALRAADFVNFSPQTLESLSCWNPDCIGFNLIEYLLSNICENERPGAVLVFMTGWDDISSLKDKLQAHPILGDPSRVLLLACHGSMASSEQSLIFEEPEGVRKIVLATNIAETSITINDVVFVLDCGKAKETSYDALNNTPCLLPSWISKVSVLQRRGRAGRVRPGECYHLYPRCVDAFAEYQLPEILRTPLQSLCLQIKSLNLGSISEFLSRALQSPELLAVQNAIEYIKTIGALDENENLTILGRYLSTLPVEPKLGKMLILGAILNCLDPILTIVAGLSVRDPFLTPLDKKDLAEAAKSQFSGDYSDHLALVRAYEGWKDAERDLAGYDYCWKNFLSAQSMKAIDALRKEFISLLKDTGLVDGNTTTCNVWSYDHYLIRAVLCYGLYPGICSVVHNERSFSLKTMEDGQVLLYSNSVNARESKIPYPWLVFNEKIKVNSVFLRDSTAVSDAVLLLFGGSLSRGDVDGHLKMLGGYLEFFMEPAVAEMYQSLRRELDELIQIKLLNPRMDIHTHHELLSAVRLLVSEDQCEGKFVFGRQVLKSSKISTIATQPTLVSRTESGPGGDNSKSQIQTLLTRAGYTAPTYKTKQLKNGQFRSTAEFNGMQIMGQPCNNKKSAEKDAAAEALQWLMGETQSGNEYINHMSILLKKSKKDHK
ncbi:LOW QUALITY PROTEIN: dsrm domain-containing protein/DEAD domain-containing protein/Helicase_C domain-containing protein/HA2 domain-containing protein/OB_NTP_bind domain-containing protein [Cephalotus follicularis]|uniref:RNA helicase n=1 Tax=Cephalotus follicularis TaxID=3775 RepID=A0A1Q3CPI7_CEPFO|nr:LOW QUALITY PROTEIN: dsrm domain-containing protein/DEAD domain-containing protein/Helicase_C domain-containing protein/HA2 domain-containing protein/OB_NTP_bind domain-containing protein [Cephalotus follicularis]